MYKNYLKMLKVLKFSGFQPDWTTLQKTVMILCIVLSITGKIVAASSTPKSLVIINGLPKVTCTSQLSYYVDPSRKFSLDDIRIKNFSTKTAGLIKAMNYYGRRANYWMKFSLENTDSQPVVVFLDAGEFGSIRVYQIVKGKIQIQNGGESLIKDINTPIPELNTVKLILPPKEKVEYVLRLSSNLYYDMGFNQVNILSKKQLYATYYRDYHNAGTFRFLQILFLGFMFSQMLYIIFTRVIGIKRKEYLFYLFYLVLVTAYYILKYNDVIGFYWPLDYYPEISIYTKSILLALPFLFYIKFIRYFLDLKETDEKVYAKLIYLEYFIGIYVFADTSLRFLLPATIVLNNILMIVIFVIFVTGLTIIIPLVKYKRILVNLILTGSLIAGLGDVIGILISLLQVDLRIVHTNLDSLVSGQIGIVIETIIFTASLSYKSRMMEREKIEAQQKLIAQYEENEKIRKKMKKTRNKIAQDLHDDIGSTLSTILLFSNAAKTKVRFKNGEAGDIFRKISRIAGNMIDEMSDIIWAINPMQDSMDKILKRMNYYAAPITNAQNMEFNFKVNDDIQNLYLSMEKRKNLFLVFKESIINAVKYSEGTCIHAKLYSNNNNLHMLVEDNGKGFSKHSEQGNGLNNMKIRAEDSGGQLEINSRVNEGTSVHLIMPL